MMAKARESIKNVREKLKQEENRRKVATTGFVVLAVIAAGLAAWLVAKYLWRPVPTGADMGRADSAAIAEAMDKSKIGQGLRDDRDRINSLIDKVQANSSDIKSMKSDIAGNKSAIDALRSGQTELQRRGIDAKELIKELDERLKLPPLKPLSRLEGLGENFLPSSA